MKKLSNLYLKLKIIFEIYCLAKLIKKIKFRNRIDYIGKLFTPVSFCPENITPYWLNRWTIKILKFLRCSNCFNKSIVLFYLLNKYAGRSFSLKIGITKNQNCLEGHSWVEYNNKIMFDPENYDIKNFTQVWELRIS